jgi:aryl-alcohol dehydrogenase-like predicted oxidoreductase
MKKRTLGRTGLEVSVIGFGTIPISGFFGLVDDAESIRALHTAVDAGMNLIDTSDAYGIDYRSEILVGKFLKERSDRDSIIICTKGGNNIVTGQRNFSPDYIRGCVERSLKHLGVEALNLYLLHNPSADDLVNEMSFDLLDKYKAQGKIRHWGVSENTLQECKLAISSGRPEAMQMEYNILEQETEDVFAKAKAAGMGVISRVPLKRGFLSGRFSETYEFAEGDRRTRILSPETMRKFQTRLNSLRDVAAELSRSPAEVAIRFCVSNPDVTTVIPGIRTPKQAKEDAAAWEVLPPMAIEKLKYYSGS